MGRKRTEKEMLLRRIGKWLGMGFRFHRQQGLTGGIRVKLDRANTPRSWEFEYWKKIPGNPRNAYCSFDYEKFRRKHEDEWKKIRWTDRIKEYELEQSECFTVNPPQDLQDKDEIIDWLLLEYGLVGKAGGPDIRSYEALQLYAETGFIPKKV